MGTRLAELKERVLALPLQPGVYLMKDRAGQILYIGKAKALKNRVSSYFRADKRHSPKTVRMVSQIWDFEIIVTESEFEALVLENALIKKHKPKYNILLKDDKGYPYIKVTTSQPFPTFSVAAKPAADADRYFGPYSGRRTAQQAIDTISEVLRLKTCRRVFPRDIGKSRPCLNQHLGRCIAPCTGAVTAEEYASLVEQAIALLEGKSAALLLELEGKMGEAAENLQFERAALLRDQIKAIRALGQRQKVTGVFADLDAVACVQGETKCCVVVLHFAGGTLQEKEAVFLESTSESDADEALTAFLKQYYAAHGACPRTVLISRDSEEREAIADFLSSIAGKKVKLFFPQRGRARELLKLAEKNAREEILRSERTQQRQVYSLSLLASMIGLEEPPHRLEAYDISHLGGQDTVGSMVVFEEGRPAKKQYRRFRIASPAAWQDDYAAMTEVLTRRLQHWREGDEKFCPLPDVFLIDGGLGHVHTAQKVLDLFGITIPCFGMVKDDHHRTRGLIAPDGREFGISTVPAVFALIGRIQEEAHRFAITYQRTLSGKRLTQSSLDQIPGVGEKRRSLLLERFGSMEAIQTAEIEQLSQMVPRSVAEQIYAYYHKQEQGGNPKCVSSQEVRGDES